MEALLFTLDVGLLVVLVRVVQLMERKPAEQRDLGLFAFLENKSDEVQKGLGRKGRSRA